MYSLQKQLKKSLILNMLAVLVVMLFLLNIFIQQLFKEQVLTRLQHDAESLVSVIQLNAENNWFVDPAHISTVYNRVRSGHYYLVKSDHQVIRSRSLFDYELSIKPMQKGESISYQMKGPGDENWLVWQQLIHKNKRQAEVWIAEDISLLQKQLFKFSLIAILLVMIVSMVLIYSQQKILHRAFAVFSSLRNNLQSIRHGETELSGTRVPLEISPLVTEIEMLVEQLRLRIKRTRSAIGNLAHEIKRPLQVMSLYLESGDDKGSAIQSFNNLKMIVDRELRRAKVSGTNVVGGEFQVQQEIPLLLDVMQKIYPAIQIQLAIQPGLNEIDIDRDDILELLGNLLDNACKFSHSAVSIKVQVMHQNLEIVVEDDGPGVEAGQLKNITEKGLRLDETVEGHGLGLNICLDIVNSYDGQMRFEKSALNGLKVEVKIPMID